MKFNDPFLFAIPNGMPTAERASVPRRIAANYGVIGRISLVRADRQMRLYRIDQEKEAQA